MEPKKHPSDPRSNIRKCGSYDPDKYTLDNVSSTVKVDESLIPGRSPCLTQQTVGMFLQPLTRELVEVPPRPTSKELPDAVIENMVKRDKAFWVDKPGANAYTLHDAYYNYGITTEMVLPPHQDVFPRSYQYDLDCVKYRRRRACDGMTAKEKQKPRALCRDCTQLNIPGLTPFQQAWVQDPGLSRWKYYPDLTVNLSLEELQRIMMDEVGRPFQHEACTWYNKNYPSVKHDCILHKDFRTCVNIECPSVDPLEICDDDPNVAKSGGAFVKSFNSGKSCLFSLSESEISKAMAKFPIKVTIYKMLPCGCLPTKIVLGEATIDMTKEFVQARNKFLEDPTNVSYQALKDSFRITGSDGDESGEVVMFLRISCFGKLIITKFQGGGSPTLGTGGSPGIVDRSCNPQRQIQTRDDPCVCGAARGSTGGSGVNRVGGGMGPCPQARDPYNNMPCSEPDPDDPCYCSGSKPTVKTPMACRNTDQYCLHIPKDCCPAGNKVVFQMPSDSCGMGHKQRAHFNFTSDGVGDVSRDEPGQLLPTSAEGYPGVIYDFPEQVIKLRIGKTVEMPGRKSKLEYQFITPVATHEKIVPANDTRTAQCVSFCPDCCRTKY